MKRLLFVIAVASLLGLAANTALADGCRSYGGYGGYGGRYTNSYSPARAYGGYRTSNYYRGSYGRSYSPYRGGYYGRSSYYGRSGIGYYGNGVSFRIGF